MGEQPSGSGASDVARGATYAASPSLFVVAAQVFVASAEKPKDPGAERRRLISSVLAAALFAVTTIWFTVHLETFVTSIVALGTATFWSVLQVFLSNFKRAAGDETKSFWQKLLAREWTGRVLLTLVVLALLLFLFTSSLHLKLGRTSASNVEIEILETTAKLQVLDAAKLSLAQPAEGRPVLQFLQPQNFVLRVTKPAGYHDAPVRLHAGESREITFPDDFSRRSIIRIHVPHVLEQTVPQKGDGQFARSDLYLEAPGQTAITIAPFPVATVYVGMSNRALADDLIEGSRTGYEARRRTEKLAGGVLAPLIDTQLAIEDVSRVICTNWDLEENDLVTASIRVDATARFQCSARVTEGVISDCVFGEVNVK
jgi:hypothetical protein